MAELDLTAIKNQYKTEIEPQEYWGQDYGTLNKACDMIEKLIAEVEWLRREVNTMAMVDYMQNMNEVGYITREFEPPYPDVWDGK